MSAVAVAGLAVGAYGAQQQADAARRAAEMQGQAGNLSLAEMRRQFDISQNQLAPWLRAGTRALQEQQALMGLGGDTQAAMAALQRSPGYQARLQQGSRALEGSTAARGGMGSGKAMTAAQGWGQDYASQEYGNRLNQLAGLSGTGQSTAGSLAGMGQNYARGMGDIWQNMANAQGAAGIAGQNAWQSGILGGLGAGINMANYFGRQRQPYNWATDPNPNYSGAGVPWPY